jgi:hypothetical protein
MSNNLIFNFNNVGEIVLPTGMAINSNALELAQEAGKYVTNNPYIVLPFIVRYSEILSMVVSASGSGEIRGLIEKDGKKYYYLNGWVESDGTYDQSVAISVLIANTNFFLPGQTKNIRLGLFLHSVDGTATPRISDIRLVYLSSTSLDPAKVKVFGYLQNMPDNEDAYVWLDRDKTLLNNNIILREKIFIVPDAIGYFEVWLYSTDNMQDGAGYIFVFSDSKYFRFVPEVESVSFKELPIKWM